MKYLLLALLAVTLFVSGWPSFFYIAAIGLLILGCLNIWKERPHERRVHDHL